MREGVPQCGRVCSSLGCAQCARLCPSVGGCVPVWEGLPQCGRVFPSVGRLPPVGGCAPVSLSHILMTDTQVHLCVHLIAECFSHVAKACDRNVLKSVAID